VSLCRDTIRNICGEDVNSNSTGAKGDGFVRCSSYLAAIGFDIKQCVLCEGWERYVIPVN
jgi:hypothetical protein